VMTICSTSQQAWTRKELGSQSREKRGLGSCITKKKNRARGKLASSFWRALAPFHVPERGKRVKGAKQRGHVSSKPRAYAGGALGGEVKNGSVRSTRCKGIGEKWRLVMKNYTNVFVAIWLLQ